MATRVSEKIMLFTLGGHFLFSFNKLKKIRKMQNDTKYKQNKICVTKKGERKKKKCMEFVFQCYLTWRGLCSWFVWWTMYSVSRTSATPPCSRGIEFCRKCSSISVIVGNHKCCTRHCPEIITIVKQWWISKMVTLIQTQIIKRHSKMLSTSLEIECQHKFTFARLTLAYKKDSMTRCTTLQHKGTGVSSRECGMKP